MPHGALLPPAGAPSPSQAREAREARRSHPEAPLLERSASGGAAGAYFESKGAVTTHVADYARTTLKARHRPVLRALAEALFDHEPPVPQGRLDGFAEEVDRFVSPASKTLRFGLLLMLDVIRLLPPFVVGRFATFEDLPLASRIEMLRRLERSKLAPLTLVLIAYKTILTLLFFENERELMATGYTGPDRARWRKKGLPVLNETAPSRAAQTEIE